MKTIFVLKTFNSIKYLTGIRFVVFLSTLYLPLASAENIQNLQQNASTTYEQMIQAKQLAENLAKDAAFAEKKLASVKQKLATAFIRIIGNKDLQKLKENKLSIYNLF